jgi:hypothetical protein
VKRASCTDLEIGQPVVVCSVCGAFRQIDRHRRQQYSERMIAAAAKNHRPEAYELARSLGWFP